MPYLSDLLLIFEFSYYVCELVPKYSFPRKTYSKNNKSIFLNDDKLMEINNKQLGLFFLLLKENKLVCYLPPWDTIQIILIYDK